MSHANDSSLPYGHQDGKPVGSGEGSKERVSLTHDQSCQTAYLETAGKVQRQSQDAQILKRPTGDCPASMNCYKSHTGETNASFILETKSDSNLIRVPAGFFSAVKKELLPKLLRVTVQG